MPGWPLLSDAQARSQLPDFWPLLVKAIAEDGLHTFSEAQVRQGIERGEYSVVWDGTSVLLFICRPPVCLIPYAAGSLRTLLRWERKLSKFARLRLCHEIRLLGRPGWGRVLGYRTLTTIYGKEL